MLCARVVGAADVEETYSKTQAKTLKKKREKKEKRAIYLTANCIMVFLYAHPYLSLSCTLGGICLIISKWTKLLHIDQSLMQTINQSIDQIAGQEVCFH